MIRRQLVALSTLGSGAALALTFCVLAGRGDPAVAQVAAGNPAQRIRVTADQPDTTSPNWKFLSDDLGVMIRDDERLGLRARLFVRRDGSWLPVATDGPGDTVGTIPLR